MKLLTNEQKASLESVIDKWIDDNSGDIDIYWPNHPAEKITDIIDTIFFFAHESEKAKE